MKRMLGVTILEILLVLVIASALIFVGLRTYFSFKVDSDVATVKANVDTLFGALARYYKVQCYGRYVAGTFRPGTLNPTATTPPTDPFQVSAATLQSGYFLTENIVSSPIVNGDGVNGYKFQFNRYDSTRTVCTAATNPANPVTSNIAGSGNCQTSKAIGTIVLWKVQVAVLLNDPSKAATYLKLLGGDCLSSLASKGCTGATGNYVVWEKLPSFANWGSLSGYWSFMPVVYQFRSMFITPSITTLTSDSSVSGSQYYLCTG